LVIGCGVDVVRVDRIVKALARGGDRFERRVFTEKEREACRLAPNPSVAFALRFAAKEAGLKAIGTGMADGVGWRDAEVMEAEGPGRTPGLRFHGEAVQRCVRSGVERIHLALSSDHNLALAFVVLEGSG